MGRPIKVKPRPAGTSRRGFFKASGSAAAALAAVPLLGISGTAQSARGPFMHGVASGDPLSNAVILWTRVSVFQRTQRNAVAVSYVMATDPGLVNIVVNGSTTTGPDRDYTVNVDVGGLSPNTTYYYRFSALGSQSPVGRTKTLPVGDAVQGLRMAVVSCSNHAYGYFNAYRRIAERADLDLVMHLGDYIYEYATGEYGNVRPSEPTNEIITLGDYRRRHAQYKSDPDSQEAHRQHPWVIIWDDHETANNAWVDGAENHQPTTEGDWNLRVAVALQAYYEWMPVRVVDPATPRRNQRAYAYGNLVDLIMLEQRVGGRAQQIAGSIPTSFVNAFAQVGAFADPARQLLGADQEAWLFNRLRTSSAKWKFLGQGVMFAQLKAPGNASANAVSTFGGPGGLFLNSDQWDGYQPARDRVYNVIKGSAGQPAVNNVVVLTGDIHSSWAADLTQDPNNAAGYNPATGAGSLAVEFVGTSVSSPGVDSDTNGAIAGALRGSNPHFKYINLTKRGYMLVDANASRCVCEWWHIDTALTQTNVQSFAVAYQVTDGSNRLQPATQTPNRANPPALAP